MEATYHLDESEFDYNFFKSLKATFKGKKLTLSLKGDSPNKMSQEEYVQMVLERKKQPISYVFEGNEFNEIAEKLLQGHEIDVKPFRRTTL